MHNGPLKPFGQLHTKLPRVLTHVAFTPQTFITHSLSSTNKAKTCIQRLGYIQGSALQMFLQIPGIFVSFAFMLISVL